jgi:hypothetical protein
MDEHLKAKEFEWDSFNTDKIRIKHHIEPFECEEVFFNSPFISFDDKHSAVEQRFFALGMTGIGKGLFIVFTVRNARLRIISARPMSRKERKIYHEKIKNSS